MSSTWYLEPNTFHLHRNPCNVPDTKKHYLKTHIEYLIPGTRCQITKIQYQVPYSPRLLLVNKCHLPDTQSKIPDI